LIRKVFGSPVLDTDDRFTFRFDQVGTYAYFCKLHPPMNGTVEVTPAGG
jgi:Icc protein